ncbi:MAG: S-layer homology domain-containing protein [Ruminiclostridium sp.]|nr:S-layer homology domain-containing protein [Ruminiclostridium sp.]
MCTVLFCGHVFSALFIHGEYPDETFKPDAKISREEAMVMYARARTEPLQRQSLPILGL